MARRFPRFAALCGALAWAGVLAVAGPGAAQEERLISCDTGLGQPAPYERSCREEAPSFAISDPEFNPDECLTTWATNPSVLLDGRAAPDGEVFVARVHPGTGAIREATVQALRALPAPRRSVRNGPEWAHSQRGWEIYYSCLTFDLDDVRLCRITRDGLTLTPSILPDSRGLSMRTPTTNGDSAVPKIYTERLAGSVSGGYESAAFNLRVDGTPARDLAMPPEAKMGHWLPGGRGLLYVQPVETALGGTVSQIFLYDSETGASLQLFDDGRDRFDPQAWEAPELGGDIAFSAMVFNTETGTRDVETYRRDETGAWVRWSRIPPVCEAYANVWSPEPFVFQGRSYLSMSGVRGFNPQFEPGIIWIASVDPALPEDQKVRRLVSNDSCSADDNERRDPETLVINNGQNVRIYFLETLVD